MKLFRTTRSERLALALLLSLLAGATALRLLWLSL
jgi:hypothetical protein